MAITTVDRAKEILGITTTDQDDWIGALIPQVESHYLSIRNKPFRVGTQLTVETTGLPTDEEMSLTIGNVGGIGARVGTEYFILLRSGDVAGVVTRRIVNQIEPTAYYDITAPVASSTSTTADVFFSEPFEQWTENFSVLDMSVATAVGFTTNIEQLQTIYPDGAEITAAKMIHYNLYPEGVPQTESLGDYSIQRGYSPHDKLIGGYPMSIAGNIKRFVTMI